MTTQVQQRKTHMPNGSLGQTSESGVAVQRKYATKQLRMFDDTEPRQTDTSSTFVDSMSLPIHRWFRYSAGFSALWARGLIMKEAANGRRRVLDPFVGSGTTILEAERCGVECQGIESHPFVSRIARAKLMWRENHGSFREYALSILQDAKALDGHTQGYPALIEKCFPPGILSRLHTLRWAWDSKNDGSALSTLVWLALTSILRESSPVGTAQWQYVLPKKSKANATDPYVAFEKKIFLMSDDMRRHQQYSHGPRGVLFQEDARSCVSVQDGWADLVVTSPPYANNYDYADATRLEMSFFGEVRRWSDLQDAVRKHLIRSCTQHVSELRSKTHEILEDPLLDPIRSEIVETCERLDSEKDHHGGRKPYHTMIASYFSDMAKVWVALRRATASGALVCFVVGDSAPYGIYVPVDKWFGELALAAGFRAYSFEKTRDRNVKWRNRKHRIPLHEGRLWVEG